MLLHWFQKTACRPITGASLWFSVYKNWFPTYCSTYMTNHRFKSKPNSKHILFPKRNPNLCPCFTNQLPSVLLVPHVTILILFTTPSRWRTWWRIWDSSSWSDHSWNLFWACHTSVKKKSHTKIICGLFNKVPVAEAYTLSKWWHN